MTTAEIVRMLFNLLGGLGIFLLGIKNMSEGMQAVAGNKLRALINTITNNRIAACGVGTAMTALIQSSSVTTVTVVGMVNAGIMTLTQAIPVIMGANIGTTVTAWIIGLPIAKYGLPMLGIAAFFFLFSGRERMRYAAMVFLGLGMAFYGLELMKTGMEPLREMEAFTAWFARFVPDSYLGVLQCCLVGAICTALIQSSSATIGITMSMAYAGIIRFDTAAALVLGENIGTTFTALLASLGASTNAKRAAYAHTTINIIGVLWITAIFPYYLEIVRSCLGHFGIFPDLSVAADGREIFPHMMQGIPLAHTLFNVINILVFLPFSTSLARALVKLSPDKKLEEKPHLTFFDIRMLDTPAIGIQQSLNEILRMGRIVDKMLGLFKRVLTEDQPDEERDRKIFELEDTLDIIQKEIVEFLSNLLSGNVPHAVMDSGRAHLRMADEYETIGDYVCSLHKLRLKMRQDDLPLSEQGQTALLDLHENVEAYLRVIYDAVRDENPEILSIARTNGTAITKLMKKHRTIHLELIENGQVSPLKSLIFMDMLTAYRRIKDHGLNIAEVLAGDK